MTGWNHNIHYHDIALRAVPPNCRRSLDVGCGLGLLARKLALDCQEVIAIDANRDILVRARSAGASDSRITFVEGDAMSYTFADSSFDFIAAVASLHHLPLQPALARFQRLLQPGGVLAVIGLYRQQGIQDYAWAAAALPTSWLFRRLYRCADVEAPLREPNETLPEIRAGCDAVLPGGNFRRRLFFRYSFIWRKPPNADRV
jgi:ubiquinone/menaquinone biosynthesis C-methylase UbiE